MLAHRPHLVALEPPPRGTGVLVHDATFEAWEHSFAVMRDVVEAGTDVLNQAGAGLPHLPAGSLRELLVDPLSGDYGAIRQNADAARDVARAFGRWTTDVETMALDAPQAWRGAAGASYASRMHVLAVRGAAVCLVLRQGAQVLDHVATRAEALGVRVERLVVELGRTLARVVRRLLARVAGPAGWAAFALELAVEGLSAVTDLVDDVRRVVGLVEELLALRETIRDWAHGCRDDLQGLLDVAHALR